MTHIEQTVACDPGGGWVFLVDGLNIHQSAGLVEWVAARCEPETGLGKKGQTRHSQKSGEPSRVSVGSLASDSFRVSAQTQLLAQSN